MTKYFYEPVNVLQWNFFEKVESVGHIEPFFATSQMKVGDILFLHIGAQDRNHESGIYAVAKIINLPYIFKDNPQDKCYNNLSVDAEIIYMSKTEPLIKHNDTIEYIPTYRSVCLMPNGEKLYEIIMNNNLSISDLKVNNIYSNSDITSAFKCSSQGGMRRSLRTNSLVLIVKHNNPLYDDQWTDENILNYTGMGMQGDQSIDFSQNKTLALSKTNGVNVYLFESYKDNEYYYDGEVELAGPIFQAEELDETQTLRKVVKFPLKRKDDNSKVIIDISDIEQSEKEKIKEVRKHSIEEIKEKAKKIEYNEVNTKEVKTVYRERNQFIAEYTKERAKGVCDLCGKEAPFCDKNGKPYLESHHVITLAEGGPDGIYNTVAICPNCHRKIHVLNNKEDIKKLEKVILNYLLDDDDKENIKKWKELFK